MPPETWNKKQFWAELDALGEDAVRLNILEHRYGTDHIKRRLADEWLRTKEVSQRAKLESEQIDIARSAKDAAWAAAEAARDAADSAKAANTRATIALIIATVSAIATIAAVVIPGLRPS